MVSGPKIIEPPAKRERSPYGWESLQFAFIGTSLLSWYAISLWSADYTSPILPLLFTCWAALADVLTFAVMWRWVRDHKGENRYLLYMQGLAFVLGIIIMLFWDR